MKWCFWNCKNRLYFGGGRHVY